MITCWEKDLKYPMNRLQRMQNKTVECLNGLNHFTLTALIYKTTKMHGNGTRASEVCLEEKMELSKVQLV